MFFAIQLSFARGSGWDQLLYVITMLSVGAIHFEDRFCASRKGGTGGGGWDRGEVDGTGGRWVGQGGGGWDRGEVGGTGGRWVGQGGGGWDKGEVGGTGGRWVGQGGGGWDRGEVGGTGGRWVGPPLCLTVHGGSCSCL